MSLTLENIWELLSMLKERYKGQDFEAIYHSLAESNDPADNMLSLEILRAERIINGGMAEKAEEAFKQLDSPLKELIPNVF